MEPASGQPAPAGGRHRRRRAHGPAPARSNASTGPSRTSPTRGAQETMTSLFDLPFDDDAGRRAGRRGRRPAGAPRLHRVGTDVGGPAAARDDVGGRLGRGRDLQLPAVDDRPHLLLAEGRGRAAAGRHVQGGRPVAQVQARGRAARPRPRPARRLRAEGRVPDRLRGHRAQGPRRQAAGARPAEEAPAGRGPPRRGAQAAAAGAAPQDRHRHVDRRRGDPRHPQGAGPALSRTRT